MVQASWLAYSRAGEDQAVTALDYKHNAKDVEAVKKLADAVCAQHFILQ